MAKNFYIVNPEALTGQLRALSNVASESTFRQAAVAGARVIFDEAKLRAPASVRGWETKSQKRYPGMLRDNMLIAYDREKSVEGKIASYVVTWSKEAFYGRFVEYGTSKMAAEPFLRPAFDTKQREVAQAIDEVIDRKVKEATA
ncbi:HK97-gp10 family putative phage morphogenesis protein [Burkholderia ambifaria]|uniref:HK97-gp10 family putative phage morphogenesis protein n=1 Tax=Burkholderia ambifaria TaxID=152480 RepID=UPI00158A238A|nr:HK97-gp10 family putative phage morphogenesis protein [Burkholderia ambifaria]MBR8344650.1 HK97 gp10 family phage protein [Burkholderia ambifaria]